MARCGGTHRGWRRQRCCGICTGRGPTRATHPVWQHSQLCRMVGTRGGCFPHCRYLSGALLMHLDSSILTLITFLPTAGAVVVLLLPRQGRAIQWGALLTALATFVVSLHLVAHYVVGQAGFQFEQNVSWIPTPAIRYHLGVDGLSLWLVLLTTFLAPLGVLVSWRRLQNPPKKFYLLFLFQ